MRGTIKILTCEKRVSLSLAALFRSFTASDLIFYFAHDNDDDSFSRAIISHKTYPELYCQLYMCEVVCNFVIKIYSRVKSVNLTKKWSLFILLFE